MFYKNRIKYQMTIKRLQVSTYHLPLFDSLRVSFNDHQLVAMSSTSKFKFQVWMTRFESASLMILIITFLSMINFPLLEYKSWFLLYDSQSKTYKFIKWKTWNTVTVLHFQYYRRLAKIQMQSKILYKLCRLVLTEFEEKSNI